MLPPTPWQTIQGTTGLVRVVDASGGHVCNVGYGPEAVAAAALIVRSVNDLAAGFTEPPGEDEGDRVTRLLAERDRLAAAGQTILGECHELNAAAMRARREWQKLADENVRLQEENRRLAARNTAICRAKRIDAETILRLKTTLEASDNYRTYERLRGDSIMLGTLRPKLLAEALEEARRRDRLSAENAQLRPELASGEQRMKLPICMWCGADLEEVRGLVAARESARQHMLSCDKHPAHHLSQQVKELAEDNAKWRRLLAAADARVKLLEDAIMPFAESARNFRIHLAKLKEVLDAKG